MEHDENMTNQGIPSSSYDNSDMDEDIEAIRNRALDYASMIVEPSIGMVCRKGDVQMLKHMIEQGRPVYYCDDRRWFPIHEAAAGLHFECCEVLLKTGQINVNEASHDGLTPLLLVSRNTQRRKMSTRLCRLLIEHGADVNKASLDQMTPLIQAVKSKNPSLVNLLLQHGADPHLKWYNGWTALHEAANVHGEDSMRQLLEADADPFARDSDGHTPLYVAAQEGYLPCVELLVEKVGYLAKELINIRLHDGCSPVMAASYEGHHEVVGYLLKHGAYADFTMQPVWAGPRTSDDIDDGVHALALAAQGNHYLCIRELIPYVDQEMLVKNQLDPLSVAAFRGADECAEELIRAGFPTEIKTEAPSSNMIYQFLQPIFSRPYHTPLREATRKGHTRIVELLIEAGAKMTYKGECYSPFLFAFRNRLDPAILRAYLEHDVDINSISENTQCDVPDAIVAILATDNRRVLQQLLKCGVAVNLKNWCPCRSKNGFNLLQQVHDAPYVRDFDDLIKLLSVFTDYMPNCCDRVAKIIGIPHGTVPRLDHLCRFKIRSLFKPSQLLDNRFLFQLPRLPNNVRGYLAFEPIPEKFMFY